ncbi:hypothetical protein PR048_021104 [Dryococelus australis]|uniref:Uncharacterized protein n=1 Tax=Dryococelus australis TaxID=614101 RepID=A0ABQ9GXB5_9NEOP|nr:hypothetical protein PR048_021104 [Dryococelus australis]
MDTVTQINKPRTTNLQKNRSNFNSQIVEETIALHCTLLSGTSLSMNFLPDFQNHSSKSWTHQKLLSPEFSDGFEDEVLQGAEPYKDDLPCFSALKGELQVWKQIWKSDPSQKFPKSPAEGYKQASALPNIRVLF